METTKHEQPTQPKAQPAPAGLLVKTGIQAGAGTCWDPTWAAEHPDQCAYNGPM